MLFATLFRRIKNKKWEFFTLTINNYWTLFNWLKGIYEHFLNNLKRFFWAMVNTGWIKMSTWQKLWTSCFCVCVFVCVFICVCDCVCDCVCFHAYAQKWHTMWNVKCQVWNVKCLCWSLGHAEQILFSCLCSNLAVYGWKWQWLFSPVTGPIIRLVPS